MVKWLAAAVHYDKQRVYVMRFMTQAEYAGFASCPITSESARVAFCSVLPPTPLHHPAALATLIRMETEQTERKVEKKVVGSFVAANQTGQLRVVYVIAEVESSGAGAADGRELGRYYVTGEGYRVERQAKGRYREVLTKEVITSGDPNAP